MKYFIGILLLLNLSFGQNIQELTKEATRGNADAQVNLGWMYNFGMGVRQNYAEAFKWYKLAAEQGDASAQVKLGWMYNFGMGVRQNYSEAKEWFGKSCDNGSQEGCDAYKELNLK